MSEEKVLKEARVVVGRVEDGRRRGNTRAVVVVCRDEISASR